MIVVWGDGDIVALDDGADDSEPLTEADVAEIATVLATSTKLSFVMERLAEHITEHEQAGRLQAATNASAVLAALLVRARGAVH
jgi:hypothetical protein